MIYALHSSKSRIGNKGTVRKKDMPISKYLTRYDVRRWEKKQFSMFLSE